MSDLRVAIIYHYFPHYRRGVFRELTRAMNVTFMGDGTSGDSSIPSLVLDDASQFVNVRLYSLGRLLFQPKCIPVAMFGRYEVFVFLANSRIVTTWCAALICRLRRKRVVFWGHGFLSDDLGPRNRYRSLFFSLANGFYSYGYRSKVIAQRYGVHSQNLYVGFNSLDYRTQMPLRERCLAAASNEVSPAQPANQIRIMCISRLTPSCRYDVLLRALAIARERAGLAADVVFIGDGPARPAVEALARELGLRAEFKGAMYDDVAVAPLIFGADMTVSPGKVGLTAIHSLMFGTPVISHSDYNSQMPEVEAIVEGYTGMLFRKDDEEDLARALAEFRLAFPDRERTRANCFAMVDRVYNPMRQREVLVAAIAGQPADEGDDAWTLFPSEQTHGIT